MTIREWSENHLIDYGLSEHDSAIVIKNLMALTPSITWYIDVSECNEYYLRNILIALNHQASEYF